MRDFRLYRDVNQFNPTTRGYSDEERAVFQAVINIIQTRKGERMYDPNFGVDIEDFLFETMDAESESAILAMVGSAIEEFEPRVEILYNISKVTSKPDDYKFELLLFFEIQGIEGQQYRIIESITRG
jgi:phage baseplate assembly protein W